MTKNQITVIATTIFYNDKDEILLARRGNETFKDKWSLTGGKVKYMESIEDANRREHKEELGIDIKDMIFFGYYEFFEPDHALVFCYRAVIDSKLEVDPREIAEYGWFDRKAIDNLSLAPNHKVLIKDYFEKFHRR